MNFQNKKVKAEKKRKHKKKSLAPLRNLDDVYFKHTNFERAVIKTNGRAP